MVSLLDEFLRELDQADQDKPFDFLGFNNRIPLIGPANIWYDCYGCGNATSNQPTRCRKCNSMSFVIRKSMLSRMYARLRV